MTIYLFIGISSGENPAQLDTIYIAQTLKESQDVMRYIYKEDKQSLLDCEVELEVDEINETSFWISGEDYESPYGTTTFRGYILKKEI